MKSTTTTEKGTTTMNSPTEVTIVERTEKSGRTGYKAVREGIVPTDITIGLMDSPLDVLKVLRNMKSAGMLNPETPITFAGSSVR